VSEPGSDERIRLSPGRVIAALAATLLTVISATIHSSHAAARLDEPRGWTVWVVLDVVLVTAPIVVAAATYVVRRTTGFDRQAAVGLSLATALGTALLSCLLAVSWV
jgi:hypothetical protein